MLTADIAEILLPRSKGITLIITVGNILRQDDGVGPYIVSSLQSQVSSKKVKIIDAGIAPENHIQEIIDLKPNKIIIIDAANFGGNAGEIRILDEGNISNYSLSTHTFPINAFAKLIKEDTGAEVIYLGIQGKNTDFGEGLSSGVKKSADEITEYLGNYA